MSQPRSTVLVTGFEPFDGSSLNPSQVVVEALAERHGLDAGWRLHTSLLPVQTQRVAGVLDALWHEHAPDVVLHFGESARADRFTLERIAVNLLDFRTPDNAGVRVVDQPIDPAGPDARFTTWPARALRDGLEAQGVASCLSLSAGAYLCNQALYLSLGQGERRGGCSVGFVHVPSLPEQAERGERTGPTMPRDRLIDGAHRLIQLATRLHATSR